ncbi:CLSTN1 [Lepeophtheirus salmonis]|uniref:CLSTN1 n=1 Tax=Lepeophtheirus salmonis TaxID=72036 RepID=A0A7R8CGZ6_LEPSM|nr:CLSTN1 [Lepeophtheirus salmonis]CAF2819872.1 CLSTN1 [Lepeophtheirus salmonis]
MFTPPIRAIGELVCFFEIVRHHHNNVDIPFEIEVWNQDAGTALLSAINPLNCEQIQNYQFEIEAVSCSGTYSQRIAINIRVQDVNEFSPRWITNSNPKIELKQGQIYNEIIKIEAFDSDCSSKYGDICGYEIQSKGHPFSISKNGYGLKHFRNGNKHQKEHVMCKADDHRKNRHHFGIFIRNCKLILLLRQTCKEGEENIFRPAEWRWSMPEVCDGEWHHYALNMNFPEITLIVDGEKWINESNNPEIIDDWPLHPTKDLKTKITVGACWQGSEGKLKHGFDGYLAGLTILPGINEHIEVLKCLHQCAETLQVPASLDISQGTEIIINTGENIIVIDGNDRNDITKLIQQVAYLNTQEFPSAGKRTVAINTRVMYSNNNKTILLSNQKTEINIISVPEPTIKIVGTDNFFREYNDFKLGVRILADLHIIISSNGAYSNNNKMESCSIHINPALNPDHEELNVPESLLRMLNIEGKVSDEGVNMDGGEMVYNYERVLRQVTYTNKKPAYYLNRQFKISCSQMENRFISNEYVQTESFSYLSFLLEGKKWN